MISIRRPENTDVGWRIHHQHYKPANDYHARGGDKHPARGFWRARVARHTRRRGAADRRNAPILAAITARRPARWPLPARRARAPDRTRPRPAYRLPSPGRRAEASRRAVRSPRFRRMNSRSCSLRTLFATAQMAGMPSSRARRPMSAATVRLRCPGSTTMNIASTEAAVPLPRCSKASHHVHEHRLSLPKKEVAHQRAHHAVLRTDTSRAGSPDGAHLQKTDAAVRYGEPGGDIVDPRIETKVARRTRPGEHRCAPRSSPSSR